MNVAVSKWRAIVQYKRLTLVVMRESFGARVQVLTRPFFQLRLCCGGTILKESKIK